MATFLELCQKVRREAGVSGTGPPAVTGQSGLYEKIIHWVNDAWVEIQSARGQWSWMWSEFSFETSAGVGLYQPASIGLSDLGSVQADSLSVYGAADGKSAEAPLPFVDYPEWRRRFDMGTPLAGAPSCLALRPDKALVVGPVPDDLYTIRGLYYKQASRMAANEDIPGMPEPFHGAIVQQALMYYAAHDEASQVYATAEARLNRLMGQMERTQLGIPSITEGRLA